MKIYVITLGKRLKRFFGKKGLGSGHEAVEVRPEKNLSATTFGIFIFQLDRFSTLRSIVLLKYDHDSSKYYP